MTFKRKKEPLTVKEVYHKHALKFEQVFDARLSQYWDRHGLVMQAFCSQILEYEGDDPYMRTSYKFGSDGRQVIRSIINDLGEPW